MKLVKLVGVYHTAEGHKLKGRGGGVHLRSLWVQDVLGLSGRDVSRFVRWVTRPTWCRTGIGRGRINLWVEEAVQGWNRLEVLGSIVVVGETAQ